MYGDFYKTGLCREGVKLRAGEIDCKVAVESLELKG
jgi:hypothetical protein